jgi:hypothetical protein
MKSRLLFVVAALAASLMVVGSLPAGPAGAATKRDIPTLVGVKVFNVRLPRTTKDRLRAKAINLTAGSCTNPGAGTNEYVLRGTRVSGPTTAHLRTTGTPAGIGNAASAMQAAFNTWKAADPNAPTINVATDGTSRKPTANHRYDLMFARLGTNTLAVTYTWRWSNGQYESDTAFNKQMPWFQAASEGDGCYEGVAKFDLQNTATHEFGHTYGLDHANNSPFNTMYPSATLGETYKRSLAPGDILGLRAVYG